MGNVEFKTFSFKAESVEIDGKVQGYASTFGNVDLGGDIVDKGAFKKSIKETGGRIPILADHDPTQHIGWNLRAEEDVNGLLVEGLIDLNTQKGREKHSLAKKAAEIGAKMGLSIGYQTIKAEPDKANPQIRRLKELKLFEYSIVTFPMNTLAAITSLKAASSLEEALRIEEISVALKQWKRLGYSKEDFNMALRSVFGAADKKQDPVKASQAIEQMDQLIKLFKGI